MKLSEIIDSIIVDYNEIKWDQVVDGLKKLPKYIKVPGKMVEVGMQKYKSKIGLSNVFWLHLCGDSIYKHRIGWDEPTQSIEDIKSYSSIDRIASYALIGKSSDAYHFSLLNENGKAI